jgi:CrcB protein
LAPDKRSSIHRSGPARGDFDPHLPVDPDLLPDDPSEPSPRHRPIQHVRRSRRLDVLALIAAGGFLGAVARYRVTLAWPASATGFPMATCAINISGAFLIGATLALVLERSADPRRLQPLFCTGFLGSWTTMSSLAMESDLLVSKGALGIAIAYVITTVVVGLLATWSGIVVGRTIARLAR